MLCQEFNPTREKLLEEEVVRVVRVAEVVEVVDDR
jgi:hypothetical protein